MKRDRLRAVLTVTLSAALMLSWAAPSRAGNWPGWRGPTGVGWTDEKDLPLSWNGKTTGKSYVIKAAAPLDVLGRGDLGGSGNGSSPAVSGGRIFIRDFDFLYCLGKKP